MTLAIKPIIYVAFANPEDNSAAPLPELKIEEARIREALKDAIAEDSSWDYQPGLEATRAALVERFYSNRVAIFHFGGHADPQRLLLSGETPGRQLSSAVLLEDFLARQKTLKFVFLNACSTREWAHNLVRLGVPCVIATLRDVNSEKALEFASAFYKLLAEDDTLADAFEKAKSSIHFTNDASANGAPAATRDIDEAEDCNPDVTSFPWEIYGDPEAQKWKLSIGADDPLIGLPHLDIDLEKLPDSPYVSIKGHTPDDAPIFFGRNAEIRTLYDWVLRPQADPPILLFYGQSGVGKSSLLYAGLFPRLKGVANVVYTRRNLKLIDDLHSAIGGSSDEDAQAWLNAEKPSLIILDQVEEAITHKVKKDANGKEPNDELLKFIKRVIEIFSLREAGSKARLILSFRKEYLAEIRNAFVAGTPPDTAPLVKDFWLERFDKKGIKQVVIGPTRVRALRDKYKITLAEEDLPTDIAHDIEDRDSPIATVLQIILNQLWKAAQAAAAEAKTESLVYSRALYKSLSNTDNPLHGFFSEQLAKLDPDAGGISNNDGLELDLLYEHTTALVTSTRRTLTDLKREYPQVPDLEQLLLRNKELYLLTDAADDPLAAAVDSGPATALAHDTLASVIRREFELSVQRGTRARRLLENCARGWTPDRTGDALDAADLGVVEKGLAHMRATTPDESRLVKASRNQRRIRLVALAAAILALAATGFWVRQRIREDQHNAAVLEAAREEASRQAAEQKKQNEEQARVDLWGRIQEAISNTSADLAADDGVMALVEALQARQLRVSFDQSWPGSEPSDHRIGENLFQALQTREVYRQKVGQAAFYLGDCAVALDGQNRPLLTTRQGKPYFGGFPLTADLTSASTTACDPVTRTVAFLKNQPNTPAFTFDPQPAIFLWSKGRVRTIPLDLAQYRDMVPNCLVFNRGATRLAFSLEGRDGSSASLALLSLPSGKLTILPHLDANLGGTFSPDGRYLINGFAGAVIDLAAAQPKSARLFPDANDAKAGEVAGVPVVAIAGTNLLQIVSLSTPQKFVFLPDPGENIDQHVYFKAKQIGGVAISPNGKILASETGGRLDLWAIPSNLKSLDEGGLNAADDTLIRKLRRENNMTSSPLHLVKFTIGDRVADAHDFSPDSQFLATAEFASPSSSPYPTITYGANKPDDSGWKPAGHVHVWKVIPYQGEELKAKSPDEMFPMGCALIGNYIADMAANSDIREDNQHFDFAGLQKACNSAQAGK